MSRSTRLAVLTVCVLSVGAQANVLVVSPSGPFTQIQAAVTAANDGDVLLVKTGTYATFTIHDKSLAVVADVGATALVDGNIRVVGLALAREVLISGLVAHGMPSSTFQSCLLLENNLGTIRVQDCTIRGGFTGPCGDAQGGAGVFTSKDVAFVNCEVTAGGPLADEAIGSQAGITVGFSRVVLADCVLAGGSGGSDQCLDDVNAGRPGGVGLFVHTSSEVWASGTSAVAGDGGNGISPSFGGVGGAGMRVIVSSMLNLLDCTAFGGAGGTPFGGAGPPLAHDGTSVILNHAGVARSLTASTVVRASTSRSFTFTGVAGDGVALYASPGGQWSFDPLVGWQRSVSSARLFRYGLLPGSGSLTVTVPVGSLAPGIEAAVGHIQSVQRETGGALFFGSPRVFVIVDASF